ncbi:SusE domain-containing protein [Flavobacterium sp. N3904]|uniref:SusE domain-containing protein n=1 Tax=Flavobacterium sp. N3904 TaxID=2986835 RepID=UPI002225210C|nr:SusE domain-containing protein [Flavobacterium sp. N3904]
MKNITKSIIALFAVLAFSCTPDDVQDRPVVSPETAPVLTAPLSGATYNLLEVNKDQMAERFTWTAADFGQSVEVAYSVIIDIKGNEFKTPQSLGGATSPTLQLAVSVEDMNNAVTKLGATPLVPTEFEVRVVATTGVSTTMVSEPITIVVTSYTGLLPYAYTDWYLIGAAVQGGWDNNANTDHQPMFRDGTNANIYSFTGYFLAGNFKLISEKGSWASQLGKASDTAIQIQDNAGEFTIPTEGFYKFTFDTTALTYTLVAYDASAAKEFTSIGMVGTATGSWDIDQVMAQSGFYPKSHIWSITLDLAKGAAKFRANGAWADNWGGSTAFSAIGTGGGDIPVTGKSKFIVFFNDLDGSYSMIPNQK